MISCLSGFSTRAQDGLWKLKDFKKSPSFRWVDTSGKVHSFIFKGTDYKGAPTEVFAYYSDPDKLSGKNTHQKFPAVVLVHGGGGKAFPEWVNQWAANGYAAIAIDFAGYGADGIRLNNPGPEQSDYNKFAIIEKGNLKDVWTYHSISSILLAHSWLLDQPQTLKKKTAITGISWGGYLTCIAAAVDNRFKAAVPVYGCGYYDESDIFKDQLMALSRENRERWMTWFDPSSYLSAAKMPFLFLNGNKDMHYNVIPFHKSYKLIRQSNRNVCIIPDMPHSHQAGWNPIEIKSFIDGVLLGKSNGTKITAIGEENSKVVANYQSETPLVSADFYYTNDTTSKNNERSWTRRDAQIDTAGNKVTIHFTGDFKYAFFFVRDAKNRSASSEFLIR